MTTLLTTAAGSIPSDPQPLPAEVAQPLYAVAGWGVWVAVIALVAALTVAGARFAIARNAGQPLSQDPILKIACCAALISAASAIATTFLTV